MSATLTPERQILRNALAALEAAKAEQRAASAAFAKGHAHILEAKERLRRVAEADRLAMAAEAQGIAAWAIGKAGKPADRPSDAAAMLDAQRRLAAAQEGLALLEAARQNAERKVERSHSVLISAAESVLQADAEQLARELAEARRVVWRLSDQIASLSAIEIVSAGAPPRRVRLPSSAAEILADGGRPANYPGKPPPAATWESRWREYLQRLLGDAGATADGLGGDAECPGYDGETELAAMNRLSRRAFVHGQPQRAAAP